METSKLKKFAQFARRSLLEQVSEKLTIVLADGSAARREQSEAVKKLEEEIQTGGRDRVIDRVAYTWFNRFCALRFMDANRYTRIGLVSPADGQSQPEILAEAKMGHIDEEMVPEKCRRQIFALLAGSVPSRDPQNEAYRLLLVAACNDFHQTMPFLFERIADYTELLIPDDLLSANSILTYTQETMTPEVCQDVEVVGWLYQFYISEKKDEVFEALKKNVKIAPENIPAATQLFTPHWIVRYLVENSLGCLWLLNRPNSKLIEQMDYYIKPEQAETDFLRISKPEEIRVCDPACGSGHMLTYAFDLLYAIYEEEGYPPAEIPEKILTQNLYGIEIDERAGELAAFALTMKARAKQRRFLRKPVQPNICVLENIRFDEDELREYMDFIGRNLFTVPLQTTLRQFEEADNLGSLIRPAVTDVADMKKLLDAKNITSQLFLQKTHRKVRQVLKQADYLSPKYHVVIANPPYMGGKGINQKLSSWLKEHYGDYKADLFASFLVRCMELTVESGYSGFMTPFVWMFLSSYEKLRRSILNKNTLISLVKPSYTAFFDSAIVAVCAFLIHRKHDESMKGSFFDLEYLGTAEEQSPRFFKIKHDQAYYRASASDFKKIPGSPIAFWVSDKERDLYLKNELLGEVCFPRKGLDTGENDVFLRFWYEVAIQRACFNNEDHSKRWFPYNKGGEFRRWYGNREYLINWDNDGKEIKLRTNWKSKKPSIRNAEYYFREGFSWTTVSSGGFSARYSPNGALFDNGGCTVFADFHLKTIGGFINSKIMSRYLEFLSPTLNFQPGDISRVLFPSYCRELILNTDDCISISKSDWDNYESTWDFSCTPLLKFNHTKSELRLAYNLLRVCWNNMTLTMQRLEEENNRVFIEAYGLQDELTPDVPLKEITLTCNPHYRYGGDKSKEELEALLLSDTMKEFISYSVGCMFGRYSLDSPGLILANQGETVDDYLTKVPNPVFAPDRDNVLPILDEGWFTDDIVERFRKFLRVTFGEEHYEENLAFLEGAIGKDIRKFFLKDFYNDHLRRYKKRPIYWLFSSPKGSFNALIYMHRYRPDTVSVVLNDYLRNFRTKLASRKDHLEAIGISTNASQGEKTRALKEVETLRKTIEEIDVYERDVLYPLATRQLEIDLDDGVMVNYTKFGAALKKIPGLDAKEE